MMARECCFRVIMRPKSILVDRKMWLWLSRCEMIEYQFKKALIRQILYKRMSISLFERKRHMGLGPITWSAFTMKWLDDSKKLVFDIHSTVDCLCASESAG
jgi:phage terminase large subunit